MNRNESPEEEMMTRKLKALNILFALIVVVGSLVTVGVITKNIWVVGMLAVAFPSYAWLVEQIKMFAEMEKAELTRSAVRYRKYRGK